MSPGRRRFRRRAACQMKPADMPLEKRRRTGRRLLAEAIFRDVEVLTSVTRETYRMPYTCSREAAAI